MPVTASTAGPQRMFSMFARLYRLALEKQESGSRYHAVAEEGIPVSGTSRRSLAEA